MIYGNLSTDRNHGNGSYADLLLQVLQPQSVKKTFTLHEQTEMCQTNMKVYLQKLNRLWYASM